MNDILQGYAEAATPDLIARFDGLDCREIYAPVIDLLPVTPARVADIGSGTGRDAAWFAECDHDVLAIEPVKELREPGKRLHLSYKITWLDDCLPDLMKARRHGPFDLVTLCGVWHHIDDPASRPRTRRPPCFSHFTSGNDGQCSPSGVHVDTTGRSCFHSGE